MTSRRAFLAGSLPVLCGQDRNPKMFGNAEAYNRFMGRWSRVVAPLLVDFAALPGTGPVLDIGSGTGMLAFEMAKRHSAIRVTGIDPSTEYVAYAKSRNPFPDRVSFQLGDAQDLHFAGSAFVACVSLLVFNFIPDAAAALREARRVSRRESPIAAAVWDYGEGMQMLRVFWDAAVEVDPAAEKLDEKHMPLCRAGQLSALWQQGGLNNVHEQPLDITTRFESFADYWDPFLLGQGPAGAWVRTLEGDRREALRKALKRRLSLSSETSAFDLPARVWAVRGTVPTNG